MRKERRSKVDAYAEQLEEWFDVEKLSYAQARQRLKKLGCEISTSTLGHWYPIHRARRLQKQLLEQISRAADSCKEIEQQFSQNPAPAIETLIQLHRVLALKLSTEAQETPNLVRLVATLMKPLLDWTRLEEQRKQRELAEAGIEAQSGAADQALQPQTLEKIERELKLL